MFQRKSDKSIVELRREMKDKRERMELGRDGLIDVVSAYVPLAAPLVPAALTWAAIVQHYPDLLHIHSWAAVLIGLVAALAVESLGVLSVETALSMWQWNKEHAATERAPLPLAVGAAVVYLVTVILLVVMLKVVPQWAIGSLLPLSTLGVIASVIAVSRKQHSERIFQAELAAVEADEMGRLTAAVTERDSVIDSLRRQVSEQSATIDSLRYRVDSATADTGVSVPGMVDSGSVSDTDVNSVDIDTRRRMLADMLRALDKPADINKSELSRALGVSRGTVNNDIDALVESGILVLNGVVTVNG